MKTYFYGTAIFTNGRTATSRNFIDYDAFLRWANRQYVKDNGVTVDEYTYDTDTWTVRKVGTWHE